jgi:hypothetical protein
MQGGRARIMGKRIGSQSDWESRVCHGKILVIKRCLALAAGRDARGRVKGVCAEREGKRGAGSGDVK